MVELPQAALVVAIDDMVPSVMIQVISVNLEPVLHQGLVLGQNAKNSQIPKIRLVITVSLARCLALTGPRSLLVIRMVKVFGMHQKKNVFSVMESLKVKVVAMRALSH
jgi:hypothetical protein